MEFKIPVTKEGLTKAILMVLNFKLNLTSHEIDVLSIMINHKIDVIDTSTRELLRKIMDKNKFDINNYIKQLKGKKIILVEDKLLYLNPAITKLVDNDEFNFKFITE